MGWKAFNLFANNGDDAYLTTFPAPDPQKARTFLKCLGGTYKSRGEASLDDALYPSKANDLYVGAYANALVVGSLSVTEEAFSGRVPRAVCCATSLLPNARVLVVMLHSVVDLFGYAWYEDGKLLRARAGNAEDGIFYEAGEPLPIEQKLKALDETIDGEELVMELCRPFLGCRIDEYDTWNLKMEWFKRRTGWFGRRW